MEEELMATADEISTAARNLAIRFATGAPVSQSGQGIQIIGALHISAATIDRLCDEVKRLRSVYETRPEPGRPAARASSKPRKPSAAPRHRFVNGVCAAFHVPGQLCGAPKQRGGRPAKSTANAASAETAPPVDTRTAPLPGVTAPMGDRAADKYADGGQGSSSMRRA